MAIIKSSQPSSFLGLTDTPASYAGYAQQVVRVKGSEDGVEFYPVSLLDSANNLIANVDCLSSVYEGAWVYMDATGTAHNALADDLSTSNVIGMVESKPSLNKCVIRVGGVSAGIFVGLDTTKEYYLSDTIAGAIQTNVVTASGHIMLKIGQPFSSSKMFVQKGIAIVRA